jgi:hypothetical protein
MSLRRKVTIAIALTILGGGAYLGYRVLYTWWHIPEAYAAWDTGQLLVKYMQVNQNRWPASWDDLVTVMNTEAGPRLTLYGATAGDTNYVLSLRKTVAVDWKFDPSESSPASPVTRRAGGKFPIVWQGAEPNEMVRAYLRAAGDTNGPQFR